MKVNILPFAAVLRFSALALSVLSLPAAQPRPNVLLIYTDDHRYTGVHALGGEPVQTPHLDRLAADGIAFTRAYLMGSFQGATCIPSRATLLTGRQLFHLRDQGRVIPGEHPTIGETFRRAGYTSFIIGKWHQDRASLLRSFDSGATLEAFNTYLTDQYRMPLYDWDPTAKFDRAKAYVLHYAADGSTVRRPIAPGERRGPTATEKDGPHVSAILADSAADFLARHDRSKPFFLYLAFPVPHDPRQAPQADQNLYPPAQVKLPPSYLPIHPFDNGHQVLRDEELAPWPRTPEVARQHLADYYASITYLDAQIGRVIAELKSSGQDENTLIVMAGDSGLAVGNHGLMGKQNVYDEDGLHVPFILAGGPVHDHGRRIDALCYIHDIFPTLCDLAGVPPPDTIDGLSLGPVIRGEKAQVRDHTYHAYMQFQRAYREGDFKLIEYVRAPADEGKGPTTVRGSRVTQLFNYAEDPWETINLAFLPQHQARVAAMRRAMQAAATALSDRKESVGWAYDFWNYYDLPRAHAPSIAPATPLHPE